ncbi:MAG TPA: hypothetical protein VFU57_03285 [Candidatus Acidoferrales bacterium]|nr:hypothetical protein [Candidatus Acidoferrales bacterium]
MSKSYTLIIVLLTLAMFAVPRAGAQSANPPKQQSSTSSSAASGANAGPITVKTQPQQATATKAAAESDNANTNADKYLQVPTGTVLPLVLHNAISTRSAKAGDPVFLETIFPILIGGKITIPAGSYVSGEVTEAKRAGRVKGRAEIRIKLDNLILPNGYQASFDAIPRDAGTGGNEAVGKEGTVQGDSNKAGDANTVAQTTLAGAGIGAIASRTGKGALIGSGAGAVAGLAAVLFTRGPEAELPRGTTLDVSLNRPLYLLAEKINFTSSGQASTLPGPPNRQPQRNTGIIPH